MPSLSELRGSPAIQDRMREAHDRAIEYPLDRLTHGVLITSTIVNGCVPRIDRAALLEMPGVIDVLTAQNAPRLPNPEAPRGAATRAPVMRVPPPLQDDAVHYNGQPIGVVVADTFEHAMAAALASVPGRIDHTDTTPPESSNPMEAHNTIAWWDGDDRLSVYDSTQAIFSVRNSLAQTFNIPRENVRVVSYFTGDGFASKGGAWSHQVLAAMAAKVSGHPVKLVPTRRQVVGPVVGGPMTVR